MTVVVVMSVYGGQLTRTGTLYPFHSSLCYLSFPLSNAPVLGGYPMWSSFNDVDVCFINWLAFVRAYRRGLRSGISGSSVSIRPFLNWVASQDSILCNSFQCIEETVDW